MQRNGLTSGAYAAALTHCAVKGALTGEVQEKVLLELPGGVNALVETECAELVQNKYAVFKAIKDSGDDPDVTNGCSICVKAVVRFEEEKPADSKVFVCPEDARISLDGGIGIGRVTLPGLEQEVGYAAINKVPREMIFKAAENMLEEYGEGVKSLLILIEIPDGERLAEKTFNSKLGIEGGLSILGRTGILRPMSSEAMIEAMRLELEQKAVWNKKCVYVAPGNIGAAYLKDYIGVAEKDVVTCSNYVGDCLDIVRDMEFEKLIFAGDIGKLCKLSIGIFNTHSKVADGRGESFAYFYMKCSGKSVIADEIVSCINTEQMIEVLIREKMLENVIGAMTDAIVSRIYGRLRGKVSVKVFIFSAKYGQLGSAALGDWDD